jgi:predicted  nucleic acid-binding Zn-ribbon protein
MNTQLEKIIMLQDLDLMIHELSDSSTAIEEEKKMGFQLEEQMDTLKKARADLAEEIDRGLMAHYNKLLERYKRAVVPVKNNTCLACFLKQPTQYSTEQMNEIRTCDHCSRILYLL